MSSIFALFNFFACGFEAIGLQCVATHHISVSSVIYVHERLYKGVWKLERGGLANISKSCEAMENVGQ